MVRPALASLAVLLGLAAAGCGARVAGDNGRTEIPAPRGPIVARIGDDRITENEVDALLAEASRSFRARKRLFPEAGDAYYADLRDEAVRYLVERALREQVAEKLGVSVTEEDVDRSLAKLKPADLARDLRERGSSKAQVRRSARDGLIDFDTYVAIASKRESGESVRDALARWRTILEERFEHVGYGPGFRPAEHRRSPVPPELQNLPRPKAKCDLPDGMYPILVARAHGCLSPDEFDVVDEQFPPCPEIPANGGFDSGFTDAQIDSGYADYLMSGGTDHGFFEALTTDRQELASEADPEGPECADYPGDTEVSVGDVGFSSHRPPFDPQPSNKR